MESLFVRVLTLSLTGSAVLLPLLLLAPACGAAMLRGPFRCSGWYWPCGWPCRSRFPCRGWR